MPQFFKNWFRNSLKKFVCDSANQPQHPFLRPDFLPDWTALLASRPDLWQDALKRAENGPRVLIASNVGGHGPVSVVESMLAVALTLRGAKVHTLLCDQALPGCMRAQYDSNAKPKELIEYNLQQVCKYCFKRGTQVFSPLGLSHHRLSELLTAAEKAEAKRIADSVPAVDMKSFRWQGLSVGEHALAGALRYYARGTLEPGDRDAEIVTARYLEAALLTAFATRRLIEQEGIGHAAFHHGIYIPQGIVGEVCRKHGVHVSNWVVAYRRNTLIFSHDNTFHQTMLDEPVEQWKSLPWTDRHEEQVVSYLRSRWHGGRDWIYFHEKPDEDFDKFAAQTGMDPNKKTIGLLTNVFWDAQLHYKQNAFRDMLEWVVKTIRWFETRPDLQLLIRIHPAEIRGTVKSRQILTDEIAKAIPKLSPNIFIIGADSPVSTYAAMLKCDSAIIYGTKTGVELTSIGIPVIVAGEAWIRNKGLTFDASSEAEYFSLLDRLPLNQRLDEATVGEARKYAYHFFFRRMVPLPFVVPMDKAPNFRLEVDSLADLAAGVHPGLDVICDGIVDPAKPFVYEAENLGLHDD
ncbi:capsule biosynthesis protein [Magnetospirillum fulvum]|uniref:Capsule polysaccharide biosynthesis protein n=1 Tax=Magnetospirillum fulvum TaxID=1082 RepID=A0A1H6H367_MAGFU|nr:capsule biosynthesis protein [Magnetospirillum fulvum]SEH30119.1 Capsule polysaccharide biosynthesis protein [Magnetospirillum fulvum]